MSRDNITHDFYLQIIYKLEYNKAKPRGYTTIHDTPMLLHVRKVKDRISDVSKFSLSLVSKVTCEGRHSFLVPNRALSA